jgi:hypothetical protein
MIPGGAFFDAHTFCKRKKTFFYPSKKQKKKKTIRRKPIERKTDEEIFFLFHWQKSRGESENFSMAFVHENSFSFGPEGEKSDL